MLTVKRLSETIDSINEERIKTIGKSLSGNEEIEINRIPFFGTRIDIKTDTGWISREIED